MWAGQPDTVADGVATGLDIANVSFLNDVGDDIVFGHNNADFHSGVTDNLSTTPHAKKRWARLWDLDVNDDTGTTGGRVDLTFDISDAGGAGAFDAGGTYYLLKRPTGSTADFTEVPVVSTSITGDQLTFRVDVGQLGSEFTVGALDSPTAIELSHLAARTAMSPLPLAFGGVGAVLIGAAVWFRRRTRS